MGPRDHEDEITPHTRPPADDDADHMLVRTVECLEGRVEVELVCEPIFDYGRERRRRGRSSTAAATLRTRPAPVRRSASSPDLALGIEGSRVRARHVLEAGERGVLRPLLGGGARRARRRRRRRSAASQPRRASGAPGSVARGIPDHRWRDPIQRSALAVKGLTYMPTGATVAALTTSLPETPGGERNWDYRYTWMRDTTFTLQALHYLNLDWEADEFMQFVADVEANEDGALQIMYGIDGRRDLTESTLDHLSGYAGARPVRIGNGAFDQRQNDVFGAVLDSDPAAHAAEQAAPAAALADRPGAGRMRDGGLAEPGPGHLGGARRAAALRVLEAHVLGRARPRGEARRDPRRPGAAGERGVRPPRRSAPTSSSTASASAASSASTTRPTRSTPRRCWRRSSGSSPATTSACARPCSRSPRS